MAFHIPNTNLRFGFAKATNTFGNHGYVCTIFLSTPVDHIIACEAAFCDSRDYWNPDRGRKLALAKALTAAGLLKAERELFWEVYHTR